MLVEPDFSKNGEYRVRVHVKQPLKFVESMIDRTEPRNLIIDLLTVQKGNIKVSNTLVIKYSPSLRKCCYTLKIQTSAH
jgi:hypothetical protein